MPSKSSDTLSAVGRIGSLSLVVFSIITFIGSVLLPWIVQSPEREKQSSARSFTPRPPPGLAPLAPAIDKYKPDLLTAWMFSHLVFAAAMSLTPFVRSLGMATILVSICGLYVASPFLIPKSICAKLSSKYTKTLDAGLLGSLCVHGHRNKPSHYAFPSLPTFIRRFSVPCYFAYNSTSAPPRL